MRVSYTRVMNTTSSKEPSCCCLASPPNHVLSFWCQILQEHLENFIARKTCGCSKVFIISLQIFHRCHPRFKVNNLSFQTVDFSLEMLNVSQNTVGQFTALGEMSLCSCDPGKLPAESKLDGPAALFFDSNAYSLGGYANLEDGVKFSLIATEIQTEQLSAINCAGCSHLESWSKVTSCYLQEKCAGHTECRRLPWNQVPPLCW